jgi:RHS repeat-associated protein
VKIALKVLSLLLALLIACLPVTYAAQLSLSYDANGNLVTGDGKYRVYNGLNQLSKVYNGTDASGTLLESYIYHPTEERILVKKQYYTNGTVNQTTYYLSPTFVRVVNASGVYDATYIYHEGQLVAQNVNGTKLFIHGNHEGSSSVVTNASGSVVENTTYSPFGDIVTGGTKTKFNYEGKEADTVVGDTDFHFRKYRPDLGTFTQPDNVIQNLYDPQSLNRYTFERNNPYKYIDSSGHLVYGVQASGEAAAGGGAALAGGGFVDIEPYSIKFYKFDSHPIKPGIGLGAAGSIDFIFGLFTSAEDMKGKSLMGAGSLGEGVGPGGSINFPGSTNFVSTYITLGGGYTFNVVPIQVYGGEMTSHVTPLFGNNNDAGSGSNSGTVRFTTIVTTSVKNSKGQSISLSMSAGFYQKYLAATRTSTSSSKGKGKA